VQRQQARAVTVNLPRNVGQRELAVISHRLGWRDRQLQVEEADNADSAGNYVALEMESETITEVVTAIGERGVRAEAVANRAADEAQRYLSIGAPVGEHLADQLLVPMALAGGGSYVTGPLTPHTLTNIDIVRRFLDVQIESGQVADQRWKVSISATV
jgi:RNA 3'-terminal phosphate cyclase (ATP)